MTQVIKNPFIRGSGGGGGGGKAGGGSQRVAVEAPDSLRSRQMARIIDLVAEGEVSGLVGGLKGVYLNKTPVQNADGSLNFQGVTLSTVNGTQDQAYLPGFPSVEAEKPVNVEVKNSQSVTRQITNVNIDALRVTLSFPQLTNQNTSNGDLNGSSVNIAIDLQSNGGGFVEKINDTISGKTTTKYQRAYRIELTGSAPWDIRVRRITADSEKVSVQNQTFWDSYTEIIDSKIRYANSACCGLEVDSSQFQSIPVRGYDMELSITKVPTNYDPISRVYTGVWDGTFKLAWHDNPAWAFYDMCTDSRYGLGGFLTEAQIGKWELYAISQYCDELVDDGFGGTEPRFTCNLYLQIREEAFKVMLDMASVFRGMLFWGGGTLNTVQDSPDTATSLFSPANVIDGFFNYSGTAKSARKTVALVSWNDPADLYKKKVEYVEDADLIARYGVNEVEVVAIGCTSRGQAHRVGKWMLLSDAEVVEFKTGLDGTAVLPGKVIKIQDPNRAHKEFGGRIKAGGASTSTPLDRPVIIENGKTYTLNLTFPDGTNEEQAVTNTPGTYSTLTTNAFTQVAQDMAIWVLSANDLAPQQFRVISVDETGKAELAVVAFAYDPNKYAIIESGNILEPLRTSGAVATLPQPVNLVIGEYLINVNGEMQVVLTASCDAVAGATKYQFKWKAFNGNFTALPENSAPFMEVLGVVPGLYTVEVVAVSPGGIVSPIATASANILGTATIAVMPPVTGLQLFGQGNGTDFSGKDIPVTWKKSSATNFDALIDGGSGGLDPFFRDYEVRVYNIADELLRIEHVTDNFYTYTYEKNVLDGGPNRTVRIDVLQRGVVSDSQLSAVPATLTVTNPVPELPTGLTLQAAANFIFLNFDQPKDLDFAGTRVWLSISSGFTPDQTNQIDDTSNIGITVPDLTADTNYYLRFSPYDAFGTIDSIISAEFLIRTATLPEANIAANSITADKYNELRNSMLVTMSDSLDSAKPFEIDFPLISEMTALKKVSLSFKIKPFRSYSQVTVSGGGSTSGSGGATTPSSSSGGSSSPTSSAAAGTTHHHTYNLGGSTGGSTISYSPSTRKMYSFTTGSFSVLTADGHAHTVTVLAAGGAPSDSQALIINSGVLGSSVSGFVDTNTTNGHIHQLMIAGNGGTGSAARFTGSVLQGATSTTTSTESPASHTHTVSIAAHTHTVTIGNHSHTTPAHTHNLQQGIYEETNSPTINVYRDNGAGYGASLGAYTTDQLELDLTAQFSLTGWKGIKFTTNALCRIVAVISIKIDLSA